SVVKSPSTPSNIQRVANLVMALIKITLICCALVAAIECALLPAAVPVGIPLNTEVDPHPQYAFAYNVQDALTGDSKSQQEVRDGDVVK
ncbi:hypothetical protein KR054_002686, partial [Drosophila jambulina]